MNNSICARMMQTACICAAFLLAAPYTFGQGAVSTQGARAAAMQKFDLWVGEWAGSGWSMSQTGARTEFTLTETVQRKVGGTVLLVEGRGKTKSANGTEADTHNGLTVVSYDEKSGRYRWQGHDLATGATDTEATVVNGGLQWSIKPDTRGTTVRFTIQFGEKRWHEVGEVSADGKSWNTFMEMTLLRGSTGKM